VRTLSFATPAPASRRESSRHDTPERIQAQIVRCSCEVCGTHTNAVKAFRVAGSCPNCGSFRLVPVDGAEPLDGAPLAA
jgi:Zn finger protein HypA/HybF involved in hydrogenase expression